MTTSAKIPLLWVALAASSTGAHAQDALYACRGGGLEPPEAHGDREGHAITSGQFSCRAESGPMAGGVLTGYAVIEWNNETGVMLSGSGIVRKPGVVLVYQNVDYKVLYHKTDGRFSAASGAGRFKYVFADGADPDLAGATFVYVTRAASPEAFWLEATRE